MRLVARIGNNPIMGVIMMEWKIRSLRNGTEKMLESEQLSKSTRAVLIRQLHLLSQLLQSYILGDGELFARLFATTQQTVTIGVNLYREEKNG